jgi:hypothetical protein
MFAVWPIAWLVSTALMAIAFYGLVTPLGLVFRLLGREGLDRTLLSDQDSYWQEKPTAENKQRYLKQY